MQMKVKGQISLYLRNPWSDWAQILYAYGVWRDNQMA